MTRKANILLLKRDHVHPLFGAAPDHRACTTIHIRGSDSAHYHTGRLPGGIQRSHAALVAVWMLGGFYLALMPSLIATVMHTSTPWLSGFVVAALTLTGAVAVLIARKLPTPAVLLSGELALITGLLVILWGANQGAASFLLIGSILAGFGFGATFLGAVRSVLPLAEPHERAALMGAFYIESYLANSVPTIAVG